IQTCADMRREYLTHSCCGSDQAQNSRNRLGTVLQFDLLYCHNAHTQNLAAYLMYKVVWFFRCEGYESVRFQSQCAEIIIDHSHSLNPSRALMTQMLGIRRTWHLISAG